MQAPETKKTTAAAFIAERVNASNKTPGEIAREIGYEGRESMIAMIASGRSKLPINKIIPFANAIGVDPVFLFRLVLGEYSPETLETIDQLGLLTQR